MESGPSHRSAPCAMTQPPGAGPSPMGLLRALKRRAALALGLAILVCSASATAAWFLLPPPKYKATARLHVASHQGKVAFKTRGGTGNGLPAVPEDPDRPC